MLSFRLKFYRSVIQFLQLTIDMKTNFVCTSLSAIKEVSTAIYISKQKLEQLVRFMDALPTQLPKKIIRIVHKFFDPCSRLMN